MEIALARTLRLADGTTLDYTIAGTDWLLASAADPASPAPALPR